MISPAYFSNMQKALGIFTGEPSEAAKYASMNAALGGQSVRGCSEDIHCPKPYSPESKYVV